MVACQPTKSRETVTLASNVRKISSLLNEFVNIVLLPHFFDVVSEKRSSRLHGVEGLGACIAKVVDECA